MNKPLPRLIDIRERMRRNQDWHDLEVTGECQVSLHPEARRLLRSCYWRGDVERFSEILKRVTK